MQRAFAGAYAWWLIGGSCTVFVAVALVAGLVGRKTTAQITEGSVMGVVGKMGCGKSALMTRWALQHLAKGGIVAANFHLWEDSTAAEPIPLRGTTFLSSWSDFGSLYGPTDGPPTLVLIDEVHLAAGSHESMRLSTPVRESLSFARKRRLAVRWATQAPTRAAKPLWELTATLARCRATPGGKFRRVEVYESIAGRDTFRKDFLQGRSWVKIPRSVMRAYDHRERPAAWACDEQFVIPVDPHLSVLELLPPVPRAVEGRRRLRLRFGRRSAAVCAVEQPEPTYVGLWDRNLWLPPLPPPQA